MLDMLAFALCTSDMTVSYIHEAQCYLNIRGFPKIDHYGIDARIVLKK